jgi:catechol 2,3-dioxygenase-like lactoylglutathione lyase family enzyme
MVSAEPERLAAFYRTLGFADCEPANGSVDVITRVGLRLGEQRIGLLEPRRRGAPYPPSVPGWSSYFQHIAIVVADMTDAYAQLLAQAGWTPISTAGPQRLPEASGGVTAFKFRDPEGHPLELLWFAPGHAPAQWRRFSGDGLFLGIDHSAVSVADTDRSGSFYGQLGLKRTGGSYNAGVEQARLDDVSQPSVQVTALSPSDRPTPHVELLSYRGDFSRPTQPLAPQDIAATRLVFEVDDIEEQPAARHIRDPDGHLIVLERPAPTSTCH